MQYNAMYVAFLLQSQSGVLVTRVEGEDHTGVFGSRGEDWHTRRRILTPAFSAHKMKLVRKLCCTSMYMSERRGFMSLPDRCVSCMKSYSGQERMNSHALNIFY